MCVFIWPLRDKTLKYFYQVFPPPLFFLHCAREVFFTCQHNCKNKAKWKKDKNMNLIWDHLLWKCLQGFSEELLMQNKLRCLYLQQPAGKAAAHKEARLQVSFRHKWCHLLTNMFNSLFTCDASISGGDSVMSLSKVGTSRTSHQTTHTPAVFNQR